MQIENERRTWKSCVFSKMGVYFVLNGETSNAIFPASWGKMNRFGFMFFQRLNPPASFDFLSCQLSPRQQFCTCLQGAECHALVFNVPLEDWGLSDVSRKLSTYNREFSGSYIFPFKSPQKPFKIPIIMVDKQLVTIHLYGEKTWKKYHTSLLGKTFLSRNRGGDFLLLTPPLFHLSGLVRVFGP